MIPHCFLLWVLLLHLFIFCSYGSFVKVYRTDYYSPFPDHWGNLDFKEALILGPFPSGGLGMLKLPSHTPLPNTARTTQWDQPTTPTKPWHSVRQKKGEQGQRMHTIWWETGKGGEKETTISMSKKPQGIILTIYWKKKRQSNKPYTSIPQIPIHILNNTQF